MPKTRNAFALRDFDAARILQRKYFEEIGAGALYKYIVGEDLTDADALAYVTEQAQSDFLRDSFFAAQIQIKVIRHIISTLRFYFCHVYRHNERLLKLCRGFEVKNSIYEATNPLITEFILQRLQRQIVLKEKYNHILSVIGRLGKQIVSAVDEIEEFLNQRDRLGFAFRLKRARKAAGLTQAQLAEQLGLPPTTYAQYEQAKADPSIPRLKQIATTLKVSTDRLLDLTVTP